MAVPAAMSAAAIDAAADAPTARWATDMAMKSAGILSMSYPARTTEMLV